MGSLNFDSVPLGYIIINDYQMLLGFRTPQLHWLQELTINIAGYLCV